MIESAATPDEVNARFAAAHAQRGYTIGVYLPPQAPWETVDETLDVIADHVHSLPRDGWDGFVVGLAGDWLGLDGESPATERDRLRIELTGARATTDHMSKVMSWISGHDRQGLDHLKEATREARGRESAVKQAKAWAARARAAESALADVSTVEETPCS